MGMILEVFPNYQHRIRFRLSHHVICGLAISYSIMDSAQPTLREWIVAWRHQAIAKQFWFIVNKVTGNMSQSASNNNFENVCENDKSIINLAVPFSLGQLIDISYGMIAKTLISIFVSEKYMLTLLASDYNFLYVSMWYQHWVIQWLWTLPRCISFSNVIQWSVFISHVLFLFYWHYIRHWRQQVRRYCVP